MKLTFEKLAQYKRFTIFIHQAKALGELSTVEFA